MIFQNGLRIWSNTRYHLQPIYLCEEDVYNDQAKYFCVWMKGQEMLHFLLLLGTIIDILFQNYIKYIMNSDFFAENTKQFF